MADIPKENPFDFAVAAQKDVKLAQHVAALGQAMLADFSVRRGVEPFREAAATARKIMSEISSLGDVNLFPGSPPAPEIVGSATNDAVSSIGPQFEPSHTFERARPIKRAEQRSREKRIRKLLAILASHPKHPRAALQIDERSAIIAAEITGPTRYIRNPELVEILVRLLDVWAEANLQLVTNSRMLTAYSELVHLRAVTFWELYTGDSFEASPPYGAFDESEWILFHDRANHWEIEALRGLVAQKDATQASEIRGGRRRPSGVSPSKIRAEVPRDENKASARQEFMRPHIALAPRKPSMNGLADKSGVAQASLSRWYNGMGRLGNENLGKLCAYLGVEPREVPN